MKTLATFPALHLPSISLTQGWSRRLLPIVFAAALLGIAPGRLQAQSTDLDGDVDTNFNAGSGPNNAVLSIAAQTDGKTVLGGVFTSINGTSRNGVARLNTDGSVDTTFNPGTGANGQVDFVTVLPSGDILASGTFSSFNGNARINVVELSPTGGVVSGFVPDLQAAGSFAVAGAVVQSDGKIVLPGSVTGAGNVLLVRLGVGGGVDATFNSGTGANGVIGALALQSDGKIVVGGSFSSINGVLASGIARINTNGSVDTTFNAGTGAGGPVQAVAIQSDGQILIGGSFNSVNGSTHYGIARLAANGTLDATFNPTGPYDEITSINTIVVQTDGSIVYGGSFIAVDDYEASNIARVFANGTPDFNFLFNVNFGADSTVDALAIPPTGQLLAGGLFTTFNSSPAPFVVRLVDSTHPAFFSGETALSNGVFYLTLLFGNYFGYYSYLADPNYIYHFDLGYEYVFDAGDGEDGIYLYDFASNTFFYTSPSFPFPYLYDFTLDAVLYYFPDTSNPGHYTSNPRYFVNLNTGVIFTK